MGKNNNGKQSVAVIITLLSLLFFTSCNVTPASMNNSKISKTTPTEPDAIPETVESSSAEQFVPPEPEIDGMLSMGDIGTFTDLNVFIKSSEVIELKALDDKLVKIIELKASVKNIGDKIGGITSFETLCYDPTGNNIKENPVLDYPDVYFGNGRDNLLPGAIKTGSFYMEYTTDGVYRVYFRAVGDTVIGFNLDVKEGEKIQSDKSAAFDENIKLQYPKKLITVGDTFEFNDLLFSVKSIGLKEDSVSKMVVAVNMEIKNIGKEKYGLNIINRKFFDPDGIEIPDSIFIKSINHCEIRKNKSITGDLVFNYSKDGVYTIIFSDIGKNFEGTGETVIVGVDVKTK